MDNSLYIIVLLLSLGMPVLLGLLFMVLLSKRRRRNKPRPGSRGEIARLNSELHQAMLEQSKKLKDTNNG